MTCAQVIELDPGSRSSGCFNKTFTGPVGGRTVDCRGGRVFRSRTDRRWHVAVSSCGSPVSLNVAYTLVVYGHQGRCPVGQHSVSTAHRTCCDVTVAVVTVASVIASSRLNPTRIQLRLWSALCLSWSWHSQSNAGLCLFSTFVISVA